MRLVIISLIVALLGATDLPRAAAQQTPAGQAPDPAQAQIENVRAVLKSLGLGPTLDAKETPQQPGGTRWGFVWSKDGKTGNVSTLSLKPGMSAETVWVYIHSGEESADKSYESGLRSAREAGTRTVSTLELGPLKGATSIANHSKDVFPEERNTASANGSLVCGNLTVGTHFRTTFAEAGPVAGAQAQFKGAIETRLRSVAQALQAKAACTTERAAPPPSAPAEVTCPPPPNQPDFDYYLDLWGMWFEAYIPAPSLFTHPYNLQKSALNPIRKKKSLLPSVGSTPEEEFKLRSRAWTNGGALGRAVWDMALGFVRLHNRGEIKLSETQIRRIKALGHWAVWLQARSKVGGQADRDRWTAPPSTEEVYVDLTADPAWVQQNLPEQARKRTITYDHTRGYTWEQFALTRFESAWPKPATPDGTEYPLVGDKANTFYQQYDPPPPDPSKAPGFGDKSGLTPEEVWHVEWSHAMLLTLLEAELYAVDLAVPQAQLWTIYTVVRDTTRGYQSGGLGRGLVAGSWSLGTSKMFSWLTGTSWGPMLIGALISWSELKLLFTGDHGDGLTWLQHVSNLAALGNLKLATYVKTRSAPPEMLSDPAKGIFEGGENRQIAAQLDALTTLGAKPRQPGTNYRLIGDPVKDPSTGLERQTVAFGLVGPFQGRTKPVGEPEVRTMELVVKPGVDGPRYYRELPRPVRQEQQSDLEPVFFLNQPGYHLKKHLDEINAGFNTEMTSLLQVFKNSKYDAPLRILQQKLRDPRMPIEDLNKEYQNLVNQIIKDLAYPRVLQEERFTPPAPRPPGPLEGVHYLMVNSSCTGQQELVKIVVGKEGADAQRLINILVIDQQGRIKNAATMDQLKALDQLVPVSVARDSHFYKYPGLKDKLPVKP